MLLIVPQSGTEHVLQTRVDEFGVPVGRGAEVVGLTQDDDGVTVECADGNAYARATSWGATARTAPCGSWWASTSSASSTRRTSCWPTCI